MNVSLTLDILSYFRKCCSGSPLLTGSIYIAVLGLLCGVLMVVLGSMIMHFLHTEGILLIACGVLNILAHGSLMYGSLKPNPTTLMVYLVSASLTTLLEIVVSVLSFIGLFRVGGSTFLLGPISALVNAYSLLWVFHFYKELKFGVINNAQKA